MTTYTTGKLAVKAGVNVETIRYYERRGLLPEPLRIGSGYRQYSEKDIRRILFIKHAKELGFSLKEILELLALRVDPNCTCGDVKRRAMARLSDVEKKIKSLQRIKKALKVLIASCSGVGPTGDCPILEALEGVN